MVLRFTICLVAAVGLVGCLPPGEAEAVPEAYRVDLSDSLTRRILEWQSSRQADSLRRYLADDRPYYRYLAVRAFGSFPAVSPAVRDTLVARLDDDVPAVRQLAAYALGQTGRPEVAGALVAAFDPAATHPAVDAAILTAIGRSGGDSLIGHLAGIKTYGPRDTVLREGQLRGLYYAGLRGIVPKGVGPTLLRHLANRGAPARLRHLSANYLHRIDLPLDSLQADTLIGVLRSERDPVVSMGVIRALGRRSSPASRLALLRQLEASGDWRVRCAAIYGLSSAPYAGIRESILEALRDPHPLVRRAAADYLRKQGTEDDAPFYYQLATSTADTLGSVLLLGAANRHLSAYLPDYRERINDRLRRLYRESSDPYLRAEVATALGAFPWNYRQLYGMVAKAKRPVVRTAIAEQLYRIGVRDDFADWFRGNSRRVQRELATYYRSLIEGGEEGPAYYAARALGESPDRFRPYYPDTDWLDESLAAFDLPRQLETYREVARAAAALRGEADPTFPAAESTPLLPDWELLSETDPTVALITAEGTVRLRLWPRVAPATVSGFLKLVREGYYDGKHFHRVVPNFVAQGGGPRGDGFGSESFVLPTETPPVYWDRAGLVGMASAGRDTEGVQFFITHRPTPHLDGNYTIFGEVVEGQNVIDRLVPGSVIGSIRQVYE